MVPDARTVRVNARRPSLASQQDRNLSTSASSRVLVSNFRIFLKVKEFLRITVNQLFCSTYLGGIFTSI